MYAVQKLEYLSSRIVSRYDNNESMWIHLTVYVGERAGAFGALDSGGQAFQWIMQLLPSTRMNTCLCI